MEESTENKLDNADKVPAKNPLKAVKPDLTPEEKKLVALLSQITINNVFDKKNSIEDDK